MTSGGGGAFAVPHAGRSRGEMRDHERELDAPDRPPEVRSVRAKSRRHGKSTADKWNQ